MAQAASLVSQKLCLAVAGASGHAAGGVLKTGAPASSRLDPASAKPAELPSGYGTKVFHWAPKMADPSSVIRSTVYTGGSDGARAGCGEAKGRTGVAAMMTGGATRWCGVGMAAPLMLPPAMSACVGGSGVTQYPHVSPDGMQ